MVPGDAESIEKLVALREKARVCTDCHLSCTRKNVVFGDGNVVRPLVAFVGEAPGEAEDEEGRPFVGPAGRLLDELIEWMGLHRQQVYLMNPVLCKPPVGRDPNAKELKACKEYWHTQLLLIRPYTVVAMGKLAATALVTDAPLDTLRGQWQGLLNTFGNALVRVTYHPSYVLRHPMARRQMYDDLREVRAMADSMLLRSPPP